MLCSRNVLAKDLVSVAVDASADALTLLSPSSQSITISRCLRIERHRGFATSTASHDERALQARRFVRDTPATHLTHRPPLWSSSRALPSSICILPAQRRHRRFLSRLSRPPGKSKVRAPLRSGGQGPSPNSLLRDTSDGIGSLKGLKLVEESGREDDTPQDSQRHDQSKIQRDLEAEEAAIQKKAREEAEEAEEAAIQRKAREEAEEAAIQKKAREKAENAAITRKLEWQAAVERDYERRVKAPIRRLTATLSRLDWELPDFWQLLRVVRFGAKHQWMNNALDQFAKTLHEIQDHLVRWKRYQSQKRLQLEQASILVDDVFEQKLNGLDKGRQKFTRASEGALAIAALLKDSALRNLCEQTFGCRPTDDYGWLWLLRIRGRLSSTAYRTLAKLTCLYHEFVIFAMENGTLAHFLRQAQLERKVIQCLPNHINWEIPHSSAIFDASSALLSDAEASLSWARQIRRLSIIGAWQLGAFRQRPKDLPSGRIAFEQKVRSCAGNAKDIETLCRESCHIDSDLIAASSDRRSSVAGPIFRYIEHFVVFAQDLATIHEVLEDPDVDQHQTGFEYGLGEDEGPDEEEQNDPMTVGISSVERLRMGDPNHESFEDLKRTLFIMKGEFRKMGRSMRSFASRLRYFDALQCMVKGVHPPKYPRGQISHRRSELQVAGANNLSTSDPPLYELEPIDAVGIQPETFWLYHKGKSISIEYARTPLTGYLCLQSLVASKIVAIDVVLTSQKNRSLSDLRHLAVLVIASAEKVVILDLNAQRFGRVPSGGRHESAFRRALRNIFNDPSILKVGVGMLGIKAFLSNRYDIYVDNYCDLEQLHHPPAFEDGPIDPNFEHLAALSKDYLQWDITNLPSASQWDRNSAEAVRLRSQWPLMLFGHFALRAYATLCIYHMQKTNPIDRSAMSQMNFNTSAGATSAYAQDGVPSALAAREFGPIYIDPLYKVNGLGHAHTREDYLNGISLSMAKDAFRDQNKDLNRKGRMAMTRQLKPFQAYFLLTTFSETIDDTRRTLNLGNPYKAALAVAKEIERPFRPEHLIRLTREAELLGLIATKPRITSQSSESLIEVDYMKLGREAEDLLRQYPRYSPQIKERDHRISRSTLSSWLLLANRSEKWGNASHHKQVSKILSLPLADFTSDLVSAYNFLRANEVSISMGMLKSVHQTINDYIIELAHVAKRKTFQDITRSVLQKDGELTDLLSTEATGLLNVLSAEVEASEVESRKEVESAKFREKAESLAHRYSFLSPRLKERDEHVGRSTLLTWVLFANRDPKVVETSQELSLSRRELASDVASAFNYLTANKASIDMRMAVMTQHFAHWCKSQQSAFSAPGTSEDSDMILQLDGSLVDMTSQEGNTAIDAVITAAKTALAGSPGLKSLQEEAKSLPHKYRTLSQELLDRDGRTGRSSLLTWLLFVSCFRGSDLRLDLDQSAAAALSLSPSDLIDDLVSALNFLRANQAPIGQESLETMSSIIAEYMGRLAMPAAEHASSLRVRDILQEDGNFTEVLSLSETQKLHLSMVSAATTLGQPDEISDAKLATASVSAENRIESHSNQSSSKDQTQSSPAESLLDDRSYEAATSKRSIEHDEPWWKLPTPALPNMAQKNAGSISEAGLETISGEPRSSSGSIHGILPLSMVSAPEISPVAIRPPITRAEKRAKRKAAVEKMALSALPALSTSISSSIQDPSKPTLSVGLPPTPKLASKLVSTPRRLRSRGNSMAKGNGRTRRTPASMFSGFRRVNIPLVRRDKKVGSQ